MISKKKKVSQIPETAIIKSDAKLLIIQDGFTYTALVKTYFAQSVYEKRHDYVNDTSYCGQAPLGSPETLPYWTISKIVVNSNGSVTTTRVSNAVWTDHLTLTYS